jgi:hypothetical protein
MTDHDELGALLTASAPPTPDHTAAAAHSATLAREVVGADRGLQGRIRGLRRRHKVATAVTAAAIVLVPTGAFAAQHFLAQTGTFGNPALNPDLEDGSERINICAKDFAEYVATLAPRTVPATPGHSWQEYAEVTAHSYTKEGGCTGTNQGLVQETMLRTQLLGMASGDWGCSLVWAGEDHDRSAASTARAAMVALDSEARRVSPQEASVGTWDPDNFLRVSKDPKFVGCRR